MQIREFRVENKDARRVFNAQRSPDYRAWQRKEYRELGTSVLAKAGIVGRVSAFVQFIPEVNQTLWPLWTPAIKLNFYEAVAKDAFLHKRLVSRTIRDVVPMTPLIRTHDIGSSMVQPVVSMYRVYAILLAAGVNPLGYWPFIEDAAIITLSDVKPAYSKRSKYRKPVVNINELARVANVHPLLFHPLNKGLPL